MTIPTDDQGAGLGDAAALIASTEAKTAAALALDAVEGFPDVFRSIVPEGWKAEILDLEKYAEKPRRKAGQIRLQTTESLAQYINAHRTDGTAAYADPDHDTIVAILNDHAKDLDAAGHRDHRATLQLLRTPGCKRWYGAHGKFLSQEEFAQMVEDGLTEIAEPSGADLLEMAQTMQASTTAEFRSQTRLTSGQVQFTYVETGDARAGATGQLEIPQFITLVFAPYFGSANMQITARLRYRMSGGNLKLGVWLIQHEEALRTAFTTETDRLVELTGESGPNGEGIVSLIGTP